MPQGRIKWFNPKKGFGFIADDRGSDVFVHYTQIQGITPDSLNQGDMVQFDTIPGEKGPKAVKVIKKPALTT